MTVYSCTLSMKPVFLLVEVATCRCQCHFSAPGPRCLYCLQSNICAWHLLSAQLVVGGCGDCKENTPDSTSALITLCQALRLVWYCYCKDHQWPLILSRSEPPLYFSEKTIHLCTLYTESLQYDYICVAFHTSVGPVWHSLNLHGQTIFMSKSY